MNGLVAQRPDLAQMIVVGTTIEGRTIQGIKITGPGGGSVEKPVGMVCRTLPAPAVSAVTAATEVGAMNAAPPPRALKMRSLFLALVFSLSVRRYVSRTGLSVDRPLLGRRGPGCRAGRPRKAPPMDGPPAVLRDRHRLAASRR